MPGNDMFGAHMSGDRVCGNLPASSVQTGRRLGRPDMGITREVLHPTALPETALTSRPGGRVAWTVLLALGVIGGIQLGLGVQWSALVLVAGVALAVWDARPLLAVLTLVGAMAGYAALRTQQAQPDPLAPWMGALVTLRGDWDGQLLTLADPRARVVLSPKPEARAGPLVVSGRLVGPGGRRTPGGFDQAAWLRSQGGLFTPAPTGVLVGAELRQQAPEEELRGWFRRGLVAGLPEQQAALMQAIELGDRSEISRQDFQDGSGIRDAFTRAGLAHLMALSG